MDVMSLKSNDLTPWYVDESSPRCTLSASPGIEPKFLNELQDILATHFVVERKTLLQATGGLPPETIDLLFVIAGSITGGFLGAIGVDLYGKLKDSIAKRLFNGRKVERIVRLSANSETVEVSFESTTDDPTVITAALDAIPKIFDETRESAHYYFDARSSNWEKFVPEEVDFTVNGIAATTGRRIINGKKVFLRRQELEILASQSVGQSFLHEHKGRPIGRIEQAWVDGDKLRYRAVIFKPRDKESEEAVRKIKSGELNAVSISFAFSETLSPSDSSPKSSRKEIPKSS